MTKKDVTLREIARELDINKSKLHYYASIGLITPKGNLSGIFIFDRDYLIDRLNEIENYQENKDKKYSLNEIKEILSK